MRKAWSTTSRGGFSVVEVLLASAVFVMLVTALIGAYLYGQEATALAGNRARADMLADEGLEATRNIRDGAFANLIDGTYGLATTSNQWNLSGSQDVSDVFTRQTVVSTVDATRKNITTNVTWQQDPQRTGTASLVTRLTNWMATGDWITPAEPAKIDLAGNNDGAKIQTVGNYAYLVMAAGAPNLFVFDVTNPASPSQVGSFTITGAPQSVFVSGNYAYVGSSDINQELQIINISNPAAPSLAGIYNAPGSANVLGTYVVGTTAYVARASSVNNELVILNVATPAAPVLLGSLDLGASGNDIVVSGSYAYIVTTNNAQELKVINISVPAAPSQVGFLNLPGATNASVISTAGTSVFIGQTTTLYAVSVATPTAPAVTGSIVVGGTINDIALNLASNNAYLFLATQDNANEFKVLDVRNLTAPVLRGQFNIAGSSPLKGVAYSPTLDRVFAAGTSNTEEFAVLAPR